MNALTQTLGDVTVPLPERVRAYAAAICAGPTMEIDPVNHFAPGVYVRELTIPADKAIIGKLHKHAHISILLRGEISVATENGFERLTAPAVFKSPAGTQRACYTHAETTWLCVHPNPTNETDLAKLEEMFIEPSLEEFVAFQRQQLEKKA